MLLQSDSGITKSNIKEVHKRATLSDYNIIILSSFILIRKLINKTNVPIETLEKVLNDGENF